MVSATPEARAMLQQEEARVERSGLGVAALQAKFIPLAHVHHRLAMRIIIRKHLAHRLRDVPHLETAIVHKATDTLVARQVHGMSGHRHTGLCLAVAACVINMDGVLIRLVSPISLAHILVTPGIFRRLVLSGHTQRNGRGHIHGLPCSCHARVVHQYII